MPRVDSARGHLSPGAGVDARRTTFAEHTPLPRSDSNLTHLPPFGVATAKLLGAQTRLIEDSHPECRLSSLPWALDDQRTK